MKNKYCFLDFWYGFNGEVFYYSVVNNSFCHRIEISVLGFNIGIMGLK